MISVRRFWGAALGVMLVVAVGLWLWRLDRQPNTSGSDSRLIIAATIFPLADLVKQIGGEDVEVVLVLPPGVTEHSSTLTPQQLQELQRAKRIFQIGHGLDSHLVERILETVPGLRPVVVDRGIVLWTFAEADAHDEGTDPHYWLTVPNAMKIVETVASELTALDPEHGAIYAERLRDYQAQLGALEQEMQAQAQQASAKEFIAMHNAWSYFSDQYGFRLVATYEPTEGREPSLADLAHLKALVQQYGLTTFYAEPQKTSSAVTQFIQREFGLKVLVLDPVGGQPGRDSYMDLMRFNMKNLSQ